VPSSRTSSPRDDGGPLAFAGLYELWRDAALPEDHERAWLWTATIITTSAPDELGKIHDRMPMVIEPHRWADWLDPENADPADLRALLAPAAVSGLISYPVSTAVNAVRNNGPQLIERAEPGPAEGDLGRGAPGAGSRRSRSAASQGASGSAPDKLL
jgi:putative SOS response-associated peptidase YedK